MRIPIICDKQNCCPFQNPYGYIYMLINTVNGHKYIGKHVFHKPYLDKNYWGSGGKHLQNAKKVYGITAFDQIILQWIETNEEDLKKAEIFWIDVFGTHRNSEDYNETPGGDGFDEYTPEMRKHWSDMFSGENNPNNGKINPNFHGENNPNFHTRWSTQHARNKQKSIIRQRHLEGCYDGKMPKGKNHFKARPVVQISIDESKVIKTYKYARQAVYESNGYFTAVGIMDCCKGRQNSHKGYIWKYLDETTGGK